MQKRLQAASARSRWRSNSTANPETPTALSPLTGKLRDEIGDWLTPSHTTRRGKRLRYYVSIRLIAGRTKSDASGWRLPGPGLERAVARILADHFDARAKGQTLLASSEIVRVAAAARATADLVDRLRRWDAAVLRSLVASGCLAPGEIAIELDRDVLAATLDLSAEDIAPAALSIIAPLQLRRRGVETRIVAGAQEPAPDQVLIRMLAKAHCWLGEIRRGATLSAIANREGCTGTYVSLRLQLAFLAPRIQASIPDGTQPPDVTPERIVGAGVPLDWSEQERLFGFGA